MTKLAIISTHPIQYYAPWFRHIAQQHDLQVKVFYLWDFGVTEQVDAGFKRALRWDIPLLDGYEYEFVQNSSRSPGTDHFWGLRNPSLLGSVSAYRPDAVLLLGYNNASMLNFIHRWRVTPLLFRGDSHRLVARTGYQERARRAVISRIFKRFSAFLYVGQANHDYFRYHRVNPEKLFFAPHAVDNDRFFASHEEAAQQATVWRRELGIQARHAVVLFAGKLEDKKRPQELLQAFVQARLPETTLLFVGNGALEGELRRQASGQPHVVFAPFQNQTQMPRTYLAADVVVLPSQGASETWGLAVNEAMCMARPVITSSHVGCSRDLVKAYKNGLNFPAGDIAALSRCLTEAISDQERLSAWGAESRRIVSQYSYDRATTGLLLALDKIDGRKMAVPLSRRRITTCL